MKNKISMFLLLLLLTTFMGALSLNIARVEAYQGPRIYITPTPVYYDTRNATVGTRFNVTIWMENNTEIGLDGWQVELHYDDSIINVTEDENGVRGWPSATRGANKYNNQYVFYAATAVASSMLFPSYTHISANEGLVLLADSIIVGTAWKGAKGLLAIVEFEIKAIPIGGALSCTLDITNDYTWIKPDSLNTIATYEDGFYEIEYYVPPPTIPWVEASPKFYEAIKPKEFNIDIVIKNVSESQKLVAVQFIVKYNDTYLEVTDITEGPFMPNASWAIHGTFPIWFVEEGTITFGDIILPNATGEYDLPMYPSGDGVIATITFKPTQHIAASFDITIEPLFDILFMDMNGDPIDYSDPIPCSYVYSPLPVPLVSVLPDYYVSSHLGENFDINVTMIGLDELWNLTYVEFKLEYNSSFLEVIDVAEGPFMAQFGDTTFNYEEGIGYVKVNISLTPTDGFPSGDGALTTITLNVTSRPPAACELTLNDVLLLDPDGFEILYEVGDGYYTMNEVLIHEITVDTKTFYIVTVSNVSISPVPMIFDPAHRMLYFNVAGWGTPSFIEITIPNNLIYAEHEEWLVLVGGETVTPDVSALNSTHTLMTINYNLASPVRIFGTWAVPEISLSVLPLVLLLATLFAFGFASFTKRKKLSLF